MTTHYISVHCPNCGAEVAVQVELLSITLSANEGFNTSWGSMWTEHVCPNPNEDKAVAG